MGSAPGQAEAAYLRFEVRDLMSAHVVALMPDDDLDLAGQLLRLLRIRHLPVVHEGRLVGIVSQRDLARVQCLSVAPLSRGEQRTIRRGMPVRRIMTTPVVTVQPTTSAIEAARILCVRRLGCLPVLEGERLVGIITKSDFVASMVRAPLCVAAPARPARVAGGGG